MENQASFVRLAIRQQTSLLSLLKQTFYYATTNANIINLLSKQASKKANELAASLLHIIIIISILWHGKEVCNGL